MVGGFKFPAPGIGDLAKQSGYMGQELLNPPSVEGWHTGAEWINSGSLMKRINFSADMVGDTSRPGIQRIIQRLQAMGELAPEPFVDNCLDQLGILEVEEGNRRQLVEHAMESGPLSWNTQEEKAASAERVGEMLQLAVSLREYLYA
jgi:hypothetical protein